ncbi:unnamed protein product [Victoria cruziana]
MLRDSGDEGIFTIPGFSQIQFEGFCRFIDQGLIEEHRFPKIKDTDQEIEFQLFGKSYQLVEPLIKERDAVYESITYFFDRNMQEQTVLLENIPLMNFLETSIVNRIYRIVIDQILQSSGIYYSTGLDYNGISVYTGTIISDWGGRSELEIDRKERIWASMGSSLSEILGNVCYPKIFLSFPNEKEKRKISSKENAILEFYQKFACVGGDLVFSESLCKELQKKKFQQRCELGRIGRRNMNQRLNLYIPQNNTFLLPRDVLATADHLIRMKFGMGTLDDMNHLKNKCIRSTADLLQDQFRLALIRLENVVRGSIYIHPSHYGCICPIDTSARVGDWGSIETPFYEIFERSKEELMVYLSPSRDEYYMVAAGNSLALTRGLQEEEVGPTRYRQKFLTIAWEQIHLQNIYPFQYFSIGASLIPFIEHNYANRALMSYNMQRQAVPLSQSEKCIVGTDLEWKYHLYRCEKIVLSGNGDTISISLVMYQCSNKNTWMHQKPQVHRAYMPWEGYNSEDVVLISKRLVYDNIYTSFHIWKYEIQTHVTSQGPERITNEIPHLEPYLLRNLDRNGIVMLGSWAKTSDILVGILMPQTAKESSYAPEDRLLRAILGIQVSTAKETCLKLPIGGRGGSIYNPEMIHVYNSQKHKIKVGDKDMPYLQDGIPVDMVFNPLGVPSRMNVGQMFECSLGLAGDLQGIHYKITPLDERYEQEASRKLVFSELYEASKQTANPWVFEPEYPVKSIRFDGRTGDPFEQPVIIGKSYMLKLIHQVDKIHGRSSGHYALVTQQPFRGRAKQGGQRVGEMEVWALEGFGVAHILQEMLTYKSDHIRAHQEYLVPRSLGEQYLILRVRCARILSIARSRTTIFISGTESFPCI